MVQSYCTDKPNNLPLSEKLAAILSYRGWRGFVSLTAQITRCLDDIWTGNFQHQLDLFLVLHWETTIIIEHSIVEALCVIMYQK